MLGRTAQVVAALALAAVLAVWPVGAEPEDTLDRQTALELVAETLLTLRRYRRFYNAVACVRYPRDDLKGQAKVTVRRRLLARSERTLSRILRRIEDSRPGHRVPNKTDMLPRHLKSWQSRLSRIEQEWDHLKADALPECRRKAPPAAQRKGAGSG